MANLNGQNIGTNYKGFLNLDSTINTPLDATLRAVTDGMGNSSVLSLSTAAFKMSALTNDGTIVGSIFNSTKKVVEITDRGVIKAYTYNSTNPTYTIGFYGAFDAGSLNLYGQGGTNGVFLTGYPIDNYILNNLIIGTSSAAIIKLGGTTSSFPAIKRNGAAIDFRLADDSGYANINCGNLVSNGTSSITNLKISNLNDSTNAITAINIANTTGKTTFGAALRATALPTTRPATVGDLYAATAADILANGDLVIGIRV